MATSLLDRLGLGNDRAITNAGQAALHRQRDDRLVAELVEAISRHESVGARRERAPDRP